MLDTIDLKQMAEQARELERKAIELVRYSSALRRSVSLDCPSGDFSDQLATLEVAGDEFKTALAGALNRVG